MTGDQNASLVRDHRRRKAEPRDIVGNLLDLVWRMRPRVLRVGEEALDLKPHHAVRRPDARRRGDPGRSGAVVLYQASSWTRPRKVVVRRR